MKARVVILPTGQVSVFIDEGTFETAAPELERFFKKLEASGIKIDALSQAEQHRHDQPHEHVKEVHHGQ
jgi:hypothetical protein